MSFLKWLGPALAVWAVLSVTACGSAPSTSYEPFGDGRALGTFDGAQPFEVAPAPAEPERDEIVADLAARVAEDQRARRAFIDAIRAGDADAVDATRSAAAAIDVANTDHMKRLTARFGWFPVTQWGRAAARDAWLLVQHADRDPAFQARVLATMSDLLDAGEVGFANYAYLYDRVAKNTGQPQRFGTQGDCVEGEGRWAPHDLEAPDDLPRLRDLAGLEPMTEYIDRVSFRCRPADG